MNNKLKIYSVDLSTELEIPMMIDKVKAGFPSPAQDYIESSIDLNKLLIKHPANTFFVKVDGDSMVDEGIDNGDILIVDKSLDVIDHKIAVCFIDGEFTVKKVEVEKTKKKAWLVPGNPIYPRIEVTEDNDFLIWGVVTHIIKQK